MASKDIVELMSTLEEAAAEYYQGNESLMTDDEYDIKLDHLATMVDSIEDNELKIRAEKMLGTVSGGSEPEGTVVYHDYPMLSLGKADDYDSLERYHSRLVAGGAKGFTLQAKLDGLALSVKYEEGKLVQLATRGDGVKGESLNHLINHVEVAVDGLPMTVDEKDDFEVRGELYISDSQFIEINKSRMEVTGEKFAHSRNAAVGITKRSMSGLDYSAELSFAAYSAHKAGNQISLMNIDDSIRRVDDLTLEEVLVCSSTMKSCTVNSVSMNELDKLVASFGELREHFDIPTDGVVIKPTNEIEMLNKMGYTSRYPVAYIAYKYPGAKATTTVEEITVSVGKTGRLTPQARVKPVEIDGVIITNVTCHNYSWLNEMGIREGSTVSVTRANDVIPAIDVVVNEGPNGAIMTPESCPECGGSLNNGGVKFPKTLTCDNLSCPSRLLHYMKSIVGRAYLYIEGLGDVALTALVESGTVKSIVDLFKLNESTLKDIPTGTTSTGNVRLLGAGNAKNIMKSVERARLHTDSNKLLAALNIQGVGPSTAGRLISHLGGIHAVLKAEPSELKKVPQVGGALIKAFELNRQRAVSQLSELMELGVQINDPELSEDRATVGTFSVSGSVDGFTNRNEFIKHMESEGWEFHRVPKKNTDVMFADPNGTSSKIKKAVSNGTRIIDKLEDL